MEREEAKKLLELCRSGVDADLQDSALAEAFALLETDSELAAWLEAQQEIDARISGSLNSIEAPAELKSTILAGMRLHEAHGAQSEAVEETETIAFPTETTPQSSKAWWLSPWTGIAALFVVMMVMLNLPESQSGATQVADADLPPVIQYLSKEISALKSWQFDKKDSDPNALRTFLASSNVPTPNSIPGKLGQMASIGCVTFDYNEDAKLSMICFKNDEVYHLITADKATYPDALPKEPTLYQCKDKAYKMWVEEDQVKILTIHGSKEEMPEFI